MTDRQVVALAAAIWVGCFVGVGVSGLIGLSLGVGALVVRSPKLLIIAGLLGGLAAGSHAEAQFVPIGRGSFEGLVEVVSLPDVEVFSERVEVRLPSGKRVLMSVSPAAGSVRRARPGNVLLVKGSLAPMDPAPWNRSRHLVGRLTVKSVKTIEAGPIHWRIAASVSTAVEQASASMSPRAAALYVGLVTGDDRRQGAAQRAEFRAVGLSHILAVSGQNVAFVLLILQFPLAFASGSVRPVLVGLLMVLFALITQLEPSVLRATFTAAIGYWAVATGRRSSGLRLLGVAAGVLLLIDPFLARAVGFQLSVLASGGILLLGPRVQAGLRGPTWLRVPAAVTISAQAAVAPVLVAVFGAVPLVSLPANLLIGWAAGMVMIWGMSVGLVAGVVPSSLSTVLQLPVRPLLWWIDWVATFCSGLPVPLVGARLLALGFGVLIIVGVGGRLLSKHQVVRLRSLLIGGVVIAAGVGLGVGAAAPGLGGAAVVSFDGGGTLIAGPETTVLVLDSRVDDRVVAGLVNRRVRHIDVVVVVGGHRGVSVVLREIRQVANVDLVLAPPQHTVVGGTRVLHPLQIPVAGGAVSVQIVDDRKLDVEIQGLAFDAGS